MIAIILYLACLLEHYTSGQSTADFYIRQDTLITGSVLVQHKITGGQTDFTRLNCVTLCLIWDECHSVSWKIDKSECSLHSVFGFKLSNQIEENIGWVTFEKGECTEIYTNTGKTLYIVSPTFNGPYSKTQLYSTVTGP